MVRRGFIDLRHGQIHVRRMGQGGPRPLVMLHTNPTSSVDLVPLIRRFGESRLVIAPDTPGLGDSDPLPLKEPTIPDYAAAIGAAIDVLGIERFDLYGSHTGANIAVELALRAPERIAHVILDGIAMYSPEAKADLLANYAPEVKPSLDGQHMLWAWHFMRDQHLFWPWFRRTADSRRANGLPDADTLHAQVVEVLKGLRGIPAAYRASFTYDKAERLRQMQVPTLLASSVVDIFHTEIGEIAAFIRNVERIDLPPYSDPGYIATALATMAEFLDRPAKAIR
jgi:pimeloyl-ACP methyl ester carboxylesterase